MKFLLVDDSPSIVEIARALLQEAGHEVEVRLSSRLALQDAAALRPDVILLDLMMPEMDGFELCRQLREKPQMAGVKIVILSGKSYDFDKRRARQLGADGYLVKPIRPETFLNDLYALISKGLKLT
jgi:two-component system alkaline phosphatase synthesis response regulator PhoP